jgi:hypothetical protein
LAPRFVLIVLILLNARQNLRQHKYAALLEKLTRPDGGGGPHAALAEPYVVASPSGASR